MRLASIQKMVIEDWRDVAKGAYSLWGAVIGLILLHASDIIFLILGIDTNPAVWTFLLTAAFIFAILGRFIKQPKTTSKIRRNIIIIVLALVSAWALPALAHPESADSFDDAAYSLVSKWEGKRNSSYQDIVGVWTICYGHTRTAGPGQHKTNSQCQQLLQDELTEYREGLHAYFTSETKRDRLPPLRDAAYTSLAFNVGIRGAGRSTATRRLNKGNIIGGCTAITWWNKAGGRVVRGLVRRRSEERAYCLRGT